MAGRQKSDTKREAILGAAAEEFARRDFHEVLMDDVAAHAGVGKGTVYRYFPTKDELFLATVLRGLEEFHEGFLRIFEERAPLETMLVAAVSRLLAYFRGRAEFFSLLLRYEHRLPEAEAARWRERRMVAVKTVTAALGREARSGGLRSIDAAFCAELFLGMARTAIQSSLADERDPSAVARQIVAVFLDGVRRSTPADGRAALRVARGGRS